MTEFETVTGNVTTADIDRWTEIFEMLKPVGNWKDPISAKVPNTIDETDIDNAVVWFCGGHPTIKASGDHWLVTGAGYYVWVGA